MFFLHFQTLLSLKVVTLSILMYRSFLLQQDLLSFLLQQDLLSFLLLLQIFFLFFIYCRSDISCTNNFFFSTNCSCISCIIRCCLGTFCCCRAITVCVCILIYVVVVTVLGVYLYVCKSSSFSFSSAII